MIAFLIHIPLILWLCRNLYKANRRQPLISYFWWALTAKLLAGIGIGLLYLHYYPYSGDTFAYFTDAVQLASFARQAPVSYLKVMFFNDAGAESFLAALPLWQQPRAFIMVKLVSVLCLLTLNNYWLCGLYLGLWCFYEVWKLANLLASLFPDSGRAAGVAFLLLPSVVFWSAGLTKESIAMACIAGIVRLFLVWRFGVVAMVKPATADAGYALPEAANYTASHTAASQGSPLSSDILSCLLLPVYLLLLWKMKYYYLAALLPAMLAFVITDFLNMQELHRKKTFFSVLLLIGTFAAILVASTLLHPNLRMSNFLDALVTNHNLTARESSPGNIIQFADLEPTFNSMLTNLPLALFSGLFRPLLWEGHTIFQWYIGLENLLLLMLTAFVIFAKKSAFHQLRSTTVLLMGATLLYSMLLAALLALSSPNFGALSRYKVAFLPFLAYLLICAAFPLSHTRRTPENK